MVDITQTLGAIIGTLASIIAIGVGAIVMQWLHGKIGEKNLAILAQVATMAAEAAEKIYKSGEGPKKMDYALSHANEALKKVGLSFNVDTIKAAIEQAVFNLPSTAPPAA